MVEESFRKSIESLQDVTKSLEETINRNVRSLKRTVIVLGIGYLGCVLGSVAYIRYDITSDNKNLQKEIQTASLRDREGYAQRHNSQIARLDSINEYFNLINSEKD